jgi:hypothetical protein
VSVSVKGISLSVCQCEGHKLNSFLGDLLFIGFESELQRKGVGRGEGNTAVRYNGMWLGWRRSISIRIYNLQCIIIYSVQCALEFLQIAQ